MVPDCKSMVPVLLKGHAFRVVAPVVRDLRNVPEFVKEEPPPNVAPPNVSSVCTVHRPALLITVPRPPRICPVLQVTVPALLNTVPGKSCVLPLLKVKIPLVVTVRVELAIPPIDQLTVPFTVSADPLLMLPPAQLA